MRRLVFIALGICGSIASAFPALPTLGQEPAESATKATLANSPVLLPVDVAEVEIALGRLRLAPDRFRILRKHEQWECAEPAGQTSLPTVPQKSASGSASASSTQPASGIPANIGQRSYQVSACNGRPALRLTYADPHEKWTLNLDGRIGAEFTRSFRQNNQVVEVSYHQKPQQPIEINIVVDGQPPVRLTGTTLWHLTDQKSPQFTQYVLPSLARINPAWDLPNALAAAKRMQTQRGLTNLVCPHQLAQNLADLDASDHRQRQQAKQKMAQAGLAAQIPLEKLRSSRLSPQQLSTVNELLAGLEPRTADTPTRLAYWLSGDPNWR